MAFSPPTEGLLALASALPLIALGGLLLYLRPRRTENVYFAAFGVAWGLQVASVSLSRLWTEPDVHSFFFRTNLILELPAALFLAYFACLHPQRNLLGRNWYGPWILALFVLPGLFIFLFAPDLLIERTALVEGRPLSVYGPGITLAIFAPFFAAFYYAIYLQFRAARAPEGGIAARRARAVFLALALVVGYTASRQFIGWIISTPFLGPQRTDIVIENAILLGAGFLLVIGMLMAVLFAPGERGRDWPMAAALGIPFAVGGMERVLELLDLNLETLGLWRIGTVALVVYATARLQLFALEIRLRRVATAAVPATAAAVTLVVLLALFLGDKPSWALATTGTLGLAVNAAAVQFRHPIATRLFPSGEADPEYLYHRRLDVYRVSLDQFLAQDPNVTAADPRLRHLRKDLGLTERDHEILEFVARREIGSRGVPTTAPPRIEPGAAILGRYRIDRLLGEGAHGRAYLAWDQKEDRNVVVKAVGTSLLGGRAAQMLLREARIAGSLHHPNVVSILDVAETPTEALIVMEYADGGSLYGLLRRRGRLSLDEAVRLLDQVLAALEAAHATGVIHRDLKPENILLMADGTAKLADFGVARETRPNATVGLTQGQGAVGTLIYMSPEQVRGRDVDARSDLYAAAVVFHQTLTGRFYLRVAGRDDFQLRQLILKGTPHLGLNDAPEPLQKFLRRALAKDADKRFQDASEMRAALRTVAPSGAAGKGFIHRAPMADA